VEQLRFGDNDTLSAHVATVLRAHWLFLLTDVDFLYTSNPNVSRAALLLPIVHRALLPMPPHLRPRSRQKCFSNTFKCPLNVAATPCFHVLSERSSLQCPAVMKTDPDAKPIYEVENVADLQVPLLDCSSLFSSCPVCRYPPRTSLFTATVVCFLLIVV